ncbi:hypothetical protein [Persicirhabdus sediminis]|uniref:Uncharacterized protein n=1 Tax=Persicirhabdus sediminis TaxID=454144 RepID=A0A8J7SJ75_9BACT|nr:hypothetical protein [Persicirhabdus sediminis]MBK1791955.1 hypothetical protein [Persicirhabdus sediminis]
MYNTLILIDPSTQINSDTLAAAMKKAFASSENQSPELIRQGNQLTLTWPSFTLNLNLADDSHILEESRELAAMFAQSHAKEHAIASCSTRVEIHSSEDPSMAHFNDFCFAVSAIEQLGTVYTFDSGTGKFLNLETLENKPLPATSPVISPATSLGSTWVYIIIAVIIISLAIAKMSFGQTSTSSPSPDSDKKMHSEAFAKVVNELEASGYFSHLAPDKQISVKKYLIEAGYFFPEETERVFSADAEDLAEIGVFEFIGQISPALAARGVYLPTREQALRPMRKLDESTGEVITYTPTRLVLDDTLPDDGDVNYLRPCKESPNRDSEVYEVQIGRHTQLIISDSFPSELIWEAAINHTIIFLNKLLEDANSEDRAYGLYADNDAHIVLLSPQQFTLIQKGNLIPDGEKPWEARLINISQ